MYTERKQNLQVQLWKQTFTKFLFGCQLEQDHSNVLKAEETTFATNKLLTGLLSVA